MASLFPAELIDAIASAHPAAAAEIESVAAHIVASWINAGYYDDAAAPRLTLAKIFADVALNGCGRAGSKPAVQ